MKMSPLKWTLATLIAVPLGLLLVTAALNQARNPGRRGDENRGNSFGPREVWAASSPLSGLFPAGGVAGRRVQKTMGVDLVEQSDKARAPQPAVGPGGALKLIHTGMVELEVKEFDGSSREVARLAEAAGGYVSSTDVRRRPSGAREGSIVVRVPAPTFQAVGASVSSLGKVLSQSTSVQDKTKDYLDLETRLRVKREAQARVREILRTRTGKLEEVLGAEKELARITEEIEGAEGQRQFFDHQIRLATLTVSLTEPEPVVVGPAGSWDALREALRDSSAMVAGSLAIMFRLLLTLLPWALLGTASWKAVAWIRRRRMAGRTPPDAG